MSGLALLKTLEDTGALTSTELRLPTTISTGEYEALGALLGTMHKTVCWAIGDFILGGEALFGERAYQLCESLSISEESRSQYVRVALAISPERRRPELTWSHHRAVYSLPPSEADHWLALAVDNGWTKRELEGQMRRDLPQQSEPQVVVEHVIQAARDLFLGSRWDQAADAYLSPPELMTNLGSALGLEVAP